MYANLLLSVASLFWAFSPPTPWILSGWPSVMRKREKYRVEMGLKNDCACVRLSRLVPLFGHLISERLPVREPYCSGRFPGDYHLTKRNWTQFKNSCNQGKVSDLPNLFRGNVGYWGKPANFAASPLKCMYGSDQQIKIHCTQRLLFFVSTV